MKWTNKGHEFDEVGKKFEHVERVVVYGAGEYGTELGRYLKGIGADFVFVDENKKNTKYMGIKVISKEELEREIQKRSKIIVVLAMGRSNSAIILKLLEQKGLQYGIDIFDIHNFLQYYLRIFAAYRYNKCILQMCGTMAVYKCSLRCKYCMGAFPYIKKDNIDFSETKKDVDLLFSKVDYVDNFGIGCGDVLLYKDFDRYLEYMMENYSDKVGKVEVLLNGMLLPNENVLSKIKKYHLTVEVSNYKSIDGWETRYDALKNLLCENDIEMKDVKFDSWLDMGWLDKREKGEAAEKFDICSMPCRIVEGGKLYYCIHGFTASQALYSRADIEDGLDLNYVEDKKIIMEYNMGFNEWGGLPMCKYCNGYFGVNQKKVSVAEQISE